MFIRPTGTSQCRRIRLGDCLKRCALDVVIVLNSAPAADQTYQSLHGGRTIVPPSVMPSFTHLRPNRRQA